jgi:bifunctional UDP-N-acetylglucosamine pyrophosphorylase/glucosamine-1-phosphate N-acetyltransferase
MRFLKYIREALHMVADPKNTEYLMPMTSALTPATPPHSEPVAVVVLAAGLGKRMGLDTPKVLVSTRRMPLLHHVLHTVKSLNPQRIVVVTGHKRELVHASVEKDFGVDSGITFAHQPEQRGTGDAVRCALPALDGFVGTVVILYGDSPLVSAKTITELLRTHHETNSTLALISIEVEPSVPYGRILRDKTSGQIRGIREAKDCSAEEHRITEMNSGVYAVDSAFLAPAVAELKNDNVQKEFYLTDIVERAVTEGQRVEAILATSATELFGVNTLAELAMINAQLHNQKIAALIESGVIIEDPKTVYVDDGVTVAAGARIGPNVQLRGTTAIGAHVVVEGSAVLRNCTIGASATIKFSVVAEDAAIGSHAAVGPFAHLRGGTVLGEHVKIGNFVETKKAVLADGAKASHLSYLGDCTVGAETNIGAGTITCNYDGYEKFQTTIGRGVFIGSNSALVAPVTIEDGATVGAGSVITKSVERDSLAVTRAPQVAKAGWSKRKREGAAKKG